MILIRMDRPEKHTILTDCHDPNNCKLCSNGNRFHIIHVDDIYDLIKNPPIEDIFYNYTS